MYVCCIEWAKTQTFSDISFKHNLSNKIPTLEALIGNYPEKNNSVILTNEKKDYEKMNQVSLRSTVLFT